MQDFRRERRRSFYLNALPAALGDCGKNENIKIADSIRQFQYGRLAERYFACARALPAASGDRGKNENKKFADFSRQFQYGRLAERSIAAVLKTVDVQASGGSNPSPSAKQSRV